jgi:hypothetical protein
LEGTSSAGTARPISRRSEAGLIGIRANSSALKVRLRLPRRTISA